MIAVIDYGMGNVGSILNMLRHVNARAELTRDFNVLASADGMILPGVGAFDEGMRRLNELELVRPLTELVLQRGKPILGICLGMQLLARGSEEGSLPGLGWVDGHCRRLRVGGGGLKVPHMGWNHVRIRRPNAVLDGSGDDPRFYFVHSFHVVCNSEADILAETHHGDWFVSALQRGSVTGVQFHPEKSHRYGKRLFANFVRLAEGSRTDE